ncbi:MAG TPA: Flp pilus assembly protein CpaB [Armatimonadetes bacterium]|nr:Flp pilus assembly protein CpaB [Armatimonadota bacterium]
MLRRPIIVIPGLVLIGIFIFFLLRPRLFRPRVPEVVGPKTVSVVYAAEDIQPYEAISNDMIEVREVEEDTFNQWPEEERANVLHSTQEAINKVVGELILKGDPILKTHLIGDLLKDKLAIKIPPGMRAFSIPIPEPPSLYHNQHIKVGDRVDILATFNNNYTNTLVEDVRVLAIDDFPGGEKPAPPAEEGEGKEKEEKPQPQVPTTPSITVAVTPEQAQTLALALANADFDVTLHQQTTEAEVVASGEERSLGPRERITVLPVGGITLEEIAPKPLRDPEAAAEEKEKEEQREREKKMEEWQDRQRELQLKQLERELTRQARGAVGEVPSVELPPAGIAAVPEETIRSIAEQVASEIVGKRLAEMAPLKEEELKPAAPPVEERQIEVIVGSTKTTLTYRPY